MAGVGTTDADKNWHYDWSTGGSLEDEMQYMPMVFGGPPSPLCGLDEKYCTCHCEQPYHGCKPAIAASACKPGKKENGWINSNGKYCQVMGAGTGRRCSPGCANVNYKEYFSDKSFGDEKLALPKSFSAPPNCASPDYKPIMERYVERVARQAAAHPGRTWLIFNEPDREPQQAYLDPQQAAYVYDRVYDGIKGADPTAQLFCCGTHPGESLFFDPDLPADQRNPEDAGTGVWMEEFARHVTRPLDGIHYHNYYRPHRPSSEQFYDTDGIIRVMENFADSLVGLRTKAGLDLGALPITITEWAGLGGEEKNACEAPSTKGTSRGNNLEDVMRPAARWLNSIGRLEYRHTGAAWFVKKAASAGGFQSSSLLDQGDQLTCLGREYGGYVWGQNPALTPALYAASDMCERAEIKVPLRHFGEHRRPHLQVYDAITKKHLGPLSRYASVESPDGCAHQGYFNGVHAKKRYDGSYYRFFGQIDAIKQRLCSASDSGRVQVRFEDATTAAYSSLSNTFTACRKSASKGLPLRDQLTYVEPRLAHHSDRCARMEVSLPFSDAGAHHYSHTIVYLNGRRVGPLNRFTSERPKDCNHYSYFPGNEKWPHSYYRYYGSRADIVGKICRQARVTGDASIRIALEAYDRRALSKHSASMRVTCP